MRHDELISSVHCTANCREIPTADCNLLNKHVNATTCFSVIIRAVERLFFLIVLLARLIIKTCEAGLILSVTRILRPIPCVCMYVCVYVCMYV